MGNSTTIAGTVIPPPAWYPTTLPLMYRQSNGAVLARPLNSVPNYTEDDVLDFLLYYQTIMGDNRKDWQNARCVAWSSSKNQSAYIYTKSLFQKDNNGDGSGNWWDVPGNITGIDGPLYARMQQRYIFREAETMPWLSDMQGKGGGIDLTSIPMSTDIEIPRPEFLPHYLPSLFQSTGQPYQQPAGFLTTKPVIRGGVSSGYTAYNITAADVAAMMVYTQPVVALGPTPYPVNWYINDDVNGAMAMYFKISHDFSQGHTNSQMQAWGIAGDLMVLPTLDANPFASGFTTALQSVVSFAVTFFAGKIPGGSKLTTAAATIANMGGAGISGGQVPPAGTFTAAVYAEADKLVKKVGNEKTTSYIVLAVVAAAGLWYAYQGKKNHK